MEAEFEKMKSGKAVPTRYLRSQQAKQAKAEESMESINSKLLTMFLNYLLTKSYKTIFISAWGVL